MCSIGPPVNQQAYSPTNSYVPSDTGRYDRPPQEHLRKGPRPPKHLEKEVREARLAQERPSRTLFIRNITYNTTESYLQELFGRFGDVKKIFSLVETRGMAFITYVSHHKIIQLFCFIYCISHNFQKLELISLDWRNSYIISTFKYFSMTLETQKQQKMLYRIHTSMIDRLVLHYPSFY